MPSHEGLDPVPASGRTGEADVAGRGDQSAPGGPPSGPLPGFVWGEASGDGGIDPLLVGLVEEVTRRIQAGESVDPAALAVADPAWGDEIRGLLPALRGLADLRRGVEGEGALPLPEERDGAGRRVLGDFHIVREIGRGGMGVVYEAEQAPLGRPVALKVLLAAVSMDRRAVQRFQLEAQVAGLLQHPRIVPVHAVGVISQVPYLAMRLIEGGSLADLVAELRGLGGDGVGRPPDGDPGLSALALGILSGRLPSTRGDLDASRAAEGRSRANDPAPSVRTKAFARTVARLGIQAAEALGHAHEHGVTHRDVKPANLLLDAKGDLWVADFGMAGVQGDSGLTETGDLPGTLRYMSPEQALGRRALTDHRTDIYALGVTLYELLALQPAIVGSDRQEILRRIAEEEPTPLRRLNPAVPVDLATIVAKAMAKDPAGRYETAPRLAEDLARFLDGRPIAARPVGVAGRAWRWCRRKPLQAGLSAALVLSLLGGLIGVTWGWTEAVRQGRLLASSESRTRREAAKVAAINRFLVDRLLGQASPETNPDAGRVTLLEVLDRAATEVAASFPDQPETEAAIRLAVGRAYHGLGEYAKAEVHLRAAHRILAAGTGAADPDRLEAEAELGHILCHLGRPDEAEPLLEDAVDRSRRALGPAHRVSLRAAEASAEFLTDRGRYDEAERLYRRYADEARRAGVLDPEVTLTAQNNLGELLNRIQRAGEAESILRRALAESTRARGPDNPGTCSILNNLAIALEKQGKYGEAEPLFREGLGRQRRVLGPHHPATLTIQYNLAHVLDKLGRPDEAESLFRENLDAQRACNGPEHPTTLYVASGVAAFLRSRGRLDEAEGLLRPCLEVQRRVLGDDHPSTRLTARRLDQLLKDRRGTDVAPDATPRDKGAAVDAAAEAVAASRPGGPIRDRGRIPRISCKVSGGPAGSVPEEGPMTTEITPSTERLIERAAGGDDAARHELLDRYRAQLRRMVATRLDRRMTPRVDPSDVVQETLIDAARRLDGFLADRPLPFFGWLRQIAGERIIDAHRRHLLSQRRSVARESRPADLSEDSALELGRRLVADDTSPSDRLLHRERLERVMVALEALSPRDREVLVMRHLEQLPAAEIADALGISVGAVEGRLFRALVRLRGRLEGRS